MFLSLLKRSGKLTPFLMLYSRSFAPSKMTADRYIGATLENSVFPWIPKTLHTPIRSEQLSIALLFGTGKSILPGLVRRTSYLYFSLG